MGLFGFGKNRDKGKASSGSQSSSSEFENDIRELLARPDITCRPEICEAEYKKGLSLLDNPTENNIHRAYDIMGNLAAQFDYVPAIFWMGDFMESVAGNMDQAAYWYKKSADLGDGNGARCYADMIMAGRVNSGNMPEAFRYYALAADKGVPEAAFVMGEFFRNNGDRDNALKSYQKAVNGGYAPAQTRIDQMEKGER